MKAISFVNNQHLLFLALALLTGMCTVKPKYSISDLNFSTV